MSGRGHAIRKKNTNVLVVYDDYIMDGKIARDVRENAARTVTTGILILSGRFVRKIKEQNKSAREKPTKDDGYFVIFARLFSLFRFYTRVVQLRGAKLLFE